MYERLAVCIFVVCTHTLGATLLDVTRKPRYKPDRLRARSAGRGMQIRESSNGRQDENHIMFRGGVITLI